VLAAHAGAAAARADIAWSFTESAQGWQVSDHNCGGNYAATLGIYSVVWNAAGGASGGFIQGADPSSNCYFFNAPAAALGNLSAYAGGVLTFAMQSSASSWPNDNVVVLVGTSGTVLVATITPLPTTTWRVYTVSLAAANFRRGSKTGPVASPAEFAGVLGSVAALRISAEYGSEVVETTGLDSVTLGRCCSADFDGDGDTGTDADIEAFFACLAGNCCATCGTADFDGDGDAGTDADIESFFRVLAGGSC